MHLKLTELLYLQQYSISLDQIVYTAVQPIEPIWQCNEFGGKKKRKISQKSKGSKIKSSILHTVLFSYGRYCKQRGKTEKQSSTTELHNSIYRL